MKILFAVHQFFPRHYTGTERFALNLSRQMQKLGHHVKVLTYGINENEKDGFRPDGEFLINEYTFQGIPVISIRHKIIPNDISFSIFDPKISGIIEKIVSREGFDIVHICHPMRTGSIAMSAKHKKIPMVSTLTDFWLMCPRGIAVTQSGELCYGPEKGIACLQKCYGKDHKDIIIKRFSDAKKLIYSIDTLISPTNFLADIFKNTFNCEINTIRHGTEYSVIKENKKLIHEKDPIVFGYIGTVLPHKGVHIIANALNLLKNKNIKVKIYGNYFGEYEYYENLKKMAVVDDRIELLGEYKDEELNTIMNDIDCIIAPSIWWENSPLTVLTSLAYRIPVITINVGGAAELIKDGINGFNFEIGNSESLAKAMKKIAENPEILNDIKNNIIRPPRVEEEAFEYENIYKKLIKDK